LPSARPPSLTKPVPPATQPAPVEQQQPAKPLSAPGVQGGFLDDLSAEQQEAVLSTAQHVRVIAGARGDSWTVLLATKPAACSFQPSSVHTHTHTHTPTPTHPTTQALAAARRAPWRRAWRTCSAQASSRMRSSSSPSHARWARLCAGVAQVGCSPA
jgi:hypothetical protein